MLKSFRQRRLRRVRGQTRTSSSCHEKDSASLEQFEQKFNRRQNHWTLEDSEYEDIPAVTHIIEAMRETEPALINRKLPKELLLRIFSFLDIVTLCRCAQVSKFWNQLALDGSNWQSVDLFSFQTDVEGKVIENLSKRCGGFLKKLSLKGCRNIDDRTLQIFSRHCQNLSKLVLDKCTQITDKTLSSLSENCPLLHALHTSSCLHVSDAGLKSLGVGCKKLQVLDISWCDKVTDEGVGHIASNCPNMKELILVGVTDVTDETLESLSEHCQELQILDVQKCTAITDEGIRTLCQGCHNLVSVNLSDITNLHDISLHAFSQSCTKLQTLQVAHCSNFTDSGFSTLAQKCTDLRRMDLEECNLVSNITLRNLAKHCSQLSELTLSHCELVTDEGIRELGSGSCASENLKILELDNCPLISDISLDNLIYCQNLQRIELYDCQLITRAGIKRLKIVGFGVRLDYYTQFDWNKLTTVIVTQDALEKHGAEFVCYAHQQNARVLIATSISKDELINATARSAVVQKYLSITQKYFLDGANIDVEMLTYQYDLRHGHTQYVKETNEAHKAANPHSLVVTDVPWLPDIYQGHNTWALAKYSDFLFIMAYDEQAVIPPCFAGPNAPIKKTKIGAKLFLDIGIPAHKLVLATPWYGYRFNCTYLSEDNLCFSTKDEGPHCIRTAIDYGTVSQMLHQSMGVQQYSDWYQSAFMNYKSAAGVEQIWYDDARSSKVKYDLAVELKFRGVGMFCVDFLNYANASDPTTKAMWAAFPEYNKTMHSFV